MTKNFKNNSIVFVSNNDSISLFVDASFNYEKAFASESEKYDITRDFLVRKRLS